MNKKRKIAIFDYLVTSTNPAGSCSRRIVGNLCKYYDFTVFAVDFDNPDPSLIDYVRVPAIRRPLFLLFISFHILAPAYYLLHCIAKKKHFDLCQVVESNGILGNVSYAHFCHFAYLRVHWKGSRASGIRAIVRWLDHKLHALAEPLVFRRVQHIVVPSKGLAREIENEYPFSARKIHVIPNTVDITKLKRPEDFDRPAFRSHLGLSPDDVMFAFVALGQFERKGLPLILNALQDRNIEGSKVVIVGGTRDLIRQYSREVEARGVASRIIFVGMQEDVRPYLWAADAFILPSGYEVFPLVALEAAAASLPILATPLNGIEEFLVSGKNGLLLERSDEGVRIGMQKFLTMTSAERIEMGRRANNDVYKYGPEQFVSAWQRFYFLALEET